MRKLEYDNLNMYKCRYIDMHSLEYECSHMLSRAYFYVR